MQLLLPLACAGLLVCSVPVIAQVTTGSTHESTNECRAHQGHEPGDCYCGAAANLTHKETLPDGIIQLRYETDEMISGKGQDSGCWYLTGFRTEPGYKLVKYEYTSITGFGSCILNSSVNISDQMTDQKWQKCGVVTDPSKDPNTRVDLLFKYRMQGHTGRVPVWELKSSDKDKSGRDEHNSGLTFIDTYTRDYNNGRAVIALWYAPIK
jgi:hypothetical protein